MKFLDKTGLHTLWTKIKAFFALKENGVYYVPGTSGYANWSANTAYAVGANVVNPSGECWTCKTAHTSGSSWSSTNWNRISAVALTGTIDGVTALYAGLKIAYRFQVLGGEGSTTLNVNNLGAKTITRGTGAFCRWTIGRYGVAILVYDGSAWRFGDYDSNDQYVLTDAYCSTAAGTQAKAATSAGFNYSRHNNIPFRIYFTAANTYDGNLTLNVNSQGAKALWINGSASSSSNKTIAIGVYWCYYDGTQFQLWTDGSIPAPKGLRGNAATASAAEPGSALETSIDNKIGKVNSATMLNFPVFGSDGSLLDSGKNVASFMSNNYVEGVFKPNNMQKTYTDVGLYDYGHDEPIDEPEDGTLYGDLSSIVFHPAESWNPGIHSARDYVIYCTGFTTDRNQDFLLEGVISGFLGGQKPARRFRLYVVNVLDYTLTISFIKNRPSSSTLGDIDIVSNVSEITNELKVVVAPHRTAIVDVCIPKFGGLNVESGNPVVFINVLQQSQRVRDTSSTQKAYDFNDFTESGIYPLYIYGPNASTPSTNIPGTISGRCTLQVMNSNGYIVQTVFDERMYYRVRTTSLTWSAWKRMTIESIT